MEKLLPGLGCFLAGCLNIPFILMAVFGYMPMWMLLFNGTSLIFCWGTAVKIVVD